MSMFGWCMDNRHKECREKFYPSSTVKQGRGKNARDTTVYAENPVLCDCHCHNPNKKRAKAPKRKRKS